MAVGKAGSVAELVLGMGSAVAVECPHDFSGMTHPVGGYNGYTYIHLPEKSEIPEASSAVVATPAILAARMAFSNLAIRLWLR